MSTMPRLQAAIDRLEQLRDFSTPGPWEVDTNMPFSRDLVGIFSERRKCYAVKFDSDDQPKQRTADLIVALHRTIDAQIALLKLADYAALVPNKFTDAALALADAILGDDNA